jgi:hypothetical protein
MGCGFGLLCVSALLATRLVAEGPHQAQPAEPSDPYSRSVALLKVAFPELTGQRLVMFVNGDDWTNFDGPVVPLRGLVLTVARQADTSRSAPPPLLTARFLWGAAPNLLVSLSVSGEFVDDERRREARRFSLRDTTPSTAEVRAKLAELKARFVTETAIRDHAHQLFARLAPLLGRIELGSIALAIDGPVWHATVFISTPTGRREYGVLFEPFDGRLIAMDGLR